MISITQLPDQVSMILISQIITGISKVLQTLLKPFDSPVTSIPFVPQAQVLPARICLNLNKVLSCRKLSIISLFKSGLSL